jgi:hypothetical protein
VIRPWLVLCCLLAIPQVAPAPQNAAQDAPVYEAYAIRFGILAGFAVPNLVAGGDRTRKIDIPVMVWLLKGSTGARFSSIPASTASRFSINGNGITWTVRTCFREPRSGSSATNTPNTRARRGTRNTHAGVFADDMCYRASCGHPNVTGAQQFAAAILAAVS